MNEDEELQDDKSNAAKTTHRPFQPTTCQPSVVARCDPELARDPANLRRLADGADLDLESLYPMRGVDQDGSSHNNNKENCCFDRQTSGANRGINSNSNNNNFAKLNVMLMNKRQLISTLNSLLLGQVKSNLIERVHEFTDCAYTKHEQRETIVLLLHCVKLLLNKLVKLIYRLCRRMSAVTEFNLAQLRLLSGQLGEFCSELEYELQTVVIEQSDELDRCNTQLDLVRQMKHFCLVGDFAKTNRICMTFYEQAEQLIEVCKMLNQVAQTHKIKIVTKTLALWFELNLRPLLSIARGLCENPRSRVAKDCAWAYLQVWCSFYDDFCQVARQVAYLAHAQFDGPRSARVAALRDELLERRGEQERHHEYVQHELDQLVAELSGPNYHHAYPHRGGPAGQQDGRRFHSARTLTQANSFQSVENNSFRALPGCADSGAALGAETAYSDTTDSPRSLDHYHGFGANYRRYSRARVHSQEPQSQLMEPSMAYFSSAAAARQHQVMSPIMSMDQHHWGSHYHRAASAAPYNGSQQPAASAQDHRYSQAMSCSSMASMSPPLAASDTSSQMMNAQPQQAQLQPLAPAPDEAARCGFVAQPFESGGRVRPPIPPARRAVTINEAAPTILNAEPLRLSSANGARHNQGLISTSGVGGLDGGYQRRQTIHVSELDDTEDDGAGIGLCESVRGNAMRAPNLLRSRRDQQQLGAQVNHSAGGNRVGNLASINDGLMAANRTAATTPTTTTATPASTSAVAANADTTPTGAPANEQLESEDQLAGNNTDQQSTTTEQDKWSDSDADAIVRGAKETAQMALSMYQFTKGEGDLNTTQDLFTQAELFAEEANELYKEVRCFSYKVPAGDLKKELLAQLSTIPALVQQLQFIVKNPTVGKPATFAKVDSVIRETKTLMDAVNRVVNATLSCRQHYNMAIASMRKRTRTLSPSYRGDKGFEFENHSARSAGMVGRHGGGSGGGGMGSEPDI